MSTPRIILLAALLLLAPVTNAQPPAQAVDDVMVVVAAQQHTLRAYPTAYAYFSGTLATLHACRDYDRETLRAQRQHYVVLAAMWADQPMVLQYFHGAAWGCDLLLAKL